MTYPGNLNRAALMALLALGLAGCNTFQGLGQDIEQGGEAVSDAAEEVEEEIED